ncbi:unnamed protein product [Musa hybrid cultivar]
MHDLLVASCPFCFNDVSWKIGCGIRMIKRCSLLLVERRTELRNGHESEYANYLFFALHCTVRERARIQESFAPSKKILLNFYLFFLKMIAFPLVSKYC